MNKGVLIFKKIFISVLSFFIISSCNKEKDIETDLTKNNFYDKVMSSKEYSYMAVDSTYYLNPLSHEEPNSVLYRFNNFQKFNQKGFLTEEEA